MGYNTPRKILPCERREMVGELGFTDHTKPARLTWHQWSHRCIASRHTSLTVLNAFGGAPTHFW